MESNAAGLVLRLVLKTRFSEMGWGSTPLLSAKIYRVSSVVEQRLDKPLVASSNLASGTNYAPETFNG